MMSKKRIITPNREIIVPGQSKKAKKVDFQIGVVESKGTSAVLMRFTGSIKDIVFGPDEALKAGVSLIQHATAARLARSEDKSVMFGGDAEPSKLH